MKLTRENTALDLSKLTEGEKYFVFEKCTEYGEGVIEQFPLMYWDGINERYWFTRRSISMHVVPFSKFKSIHFPEQDDKPTYEELVEALREVNRVFPIRPGDQDSGELTALWQVEQLLEKIK